MHLLTRPNFSQALRKARNAKGLPQEALDSVTGRTYISALERGLKQPTVGKVADIAAALDVHPVTLFALSFLQGTSKANISNLMTQVTKELIELADDS